MENFEESEQIEQEETSPSQLSSKRKYLLIGIITAIIVVIVGAGIFVLLTQKDVPPQVSEVISPDVITENETASWQTYRNEEFGFEMKYPPDWEYGYDNPSAPKRAQFTHINLIEDPTRSISIQITPEDSVLGRLYDPYKLSIDDYASNLFSEYEIIELQEILAIKNLQELGGFVILHHNPNFGIYINDKSLVAERGNYNSVEKILIDQILSTFRFIESDSQTQNCRSISDIDERFTCWFEEISGPEEVKLVFQCYGLPYSPACYSQMGKLKNDMEICDKAGLYSHTCKAAVAEKTPFYSEQEAESIIKELATDIVTALKEKDMITLASFVHPQKPLRFWSVDASFEITKEKVPLFLTDETIHTGWGDGSGLPFTFTQAEYYETDIYHRDFSNAPDISYKLYFYSSATTFGDQFENYNEENPITVTYAFPPSQEGWNDWTNIRLWFTEENGVWYLREIMHNQWAI